MRDSLHPNLQTSVTTEPPRGRLRALIGLLFSAGSAVAEPGSMGLRGLWAQVVNATAVGVIVGIAFWALFGLQAMHAEQISTLVDFNRQLLGQLKASIDGNTHAIEHLAGEVRHLRRPE